MKNTFAGFILLVVYVAISFNCNQKSKGEEINTLVIKFSELECRAYTLREQRYALADKIRFAQDSISKLTISKLAKQNLQINLNDWLKSKEIIVAQSLRLADTIRLQLDTIIKIKLLSKDKIKDFEKALSIELNKKNCQ